MPTGQEMLPTLRTLTLAVSRVHVKYVQESKIPITIINDFPIVTEHFLLLKIFNNNFTRVSAYN
jgi:hypothetical protein